MARADLSDHSEKEYRRAMHDNLDDWLDQPDNTFMSPVGGESYQTPSTPARELEPAYSYPSPSNRGPSGIEAEPYICSNIGA